VDSAEVARRELVRAGPVAAVLARGLAAQAPDLEAADLGAVAEDALEALAVPVVARVDFSEVVVKAALVRVEVPAEAARTDNARRAIRALAQMVLETSEARAGKARLLAF